MTGELTGSKLKLESELHRPRAADLVQRVEAAIEAAAAEVVVQHLSTGRIAESSVIDRAAEVWVIEDVEEVASELKANPLGEVKLAAQGDVPLGGAEAPQGIASKIALRRGGHGAVNAAGLKVPLCGKIGAQCRRGLSSRSRINRGRNSETRSPVRLRCSGGVRQL